MGVHRRTFLGASARLAFAAPLSRTLQASAQPSSDLRLLLVFTPNGTVPVQWLPTGGETNFKFGRILEPLEPYRSKVMVVDGLESTGGAGGSAHYRGISSVWSGAAGKSVNGTHWGGGITLDQYLAQQTKPGTRFKTLELGVLPDPPHVGSRMIYQAAGQPLTPMGSPYTAFERIFSGALPKTGESGGPDVTRILMGRKSVFDAVVADLERLKRRVGAQEWTRIDGHVSAIRGIEKQLAEPTKLNCGVPTVNGRLDVTANDSFPAVGQLQMDLAVASLACGLTRFASLQWSNATGKPDVVHRWLGITTPHHNLSHRDTCGINMTAGRCGDDAAAHEALIKINRWYAERFAYLLEKLSQAGALDSTIVIWSSDIAAGNHSRGPLPVVIAGGGGKLRTGRFVKVPNAPMGALLVTIARLFGVETESLGPGSYKGAPLGGLT